MPLEVDVRLCYFSELGTQFPVLAVHPVLSLDRLPRHNSEARIHPVEVELEI